MTLYTLGHSNRSIDELVDLLHAHHIELLVDVRAQPRSRHNPQFNEEMLRRRCEDERLSYLWAGRQLGGRRSVAADSPHTALEPGFRGFADYMQSAEFARAVDELLEQARTGPTAIMCAEYDPARCHRSLIADYLISQGHEVVHLLDDRSVQPHQIHRHVRLVSDALIYDRFASGELDLK